MSNKQQRGFSPIGLVLLVMIAACIGFVAWDVSRAVTTNKPFIETPGTKVTTPTPGTKVTNTTTPTSNGQIITGTAYESPNAGEGLSVQYTQVSGGYTYHPFQPLAQYVDSSTKITNKTGEPIPLRSIRIGDALSVDIYKGPCVSAANGQQGGCEIKIYSIQDLTL